LLGDVEDVLEWVSIKIADKMKVWSYY
jgi:hypothetical protein